MRSSRVLAAALAWRRPRWMPAKPTGWARLIDTLKLDVKPLREPEAAAATGSDRAPLARAAAEGLRSGDVNVEVVAAALGKSRRFEEEVREAVAESAAAGTLAQDADLRRVWYLAEWLLDRPVAGLESVTLEGDARAEQVAVLDWDRFITLPASAARVASRQKVLDNQLGNRVFCPQVRRTASIRQHHDAHLERRARELLDRIKDDECTLRTLYFRESRSSLSIESIFHPQQHHLDLFVDTLIGVKTESRGPFTEDLMLKIQHSVLGEAAFGELRGQHYRDNHQVYVAETVATIDDVVQEVRFVAARPQDVRKLMAGIIEMGDSLLRLREDQIAASDAVSLAAAISFGFVFVHPFLDGNGRTHRFLLHLFLRWLGFAPKIFFPISAVSARHQGEYLDCLENFSRGSLAATRYIFESEDRMVVRNDTAHVFSFFDATPMAEYLYDCIDTTLQVDLPDHIEYEKVWSSTLAGMRAAHPDISESVLRLFIRVAYGIHADGDHTRERFPGLSEDVFDDLLARMEPLRAFQVREKRMAW